jgi:hypothetical protein
MRRRSSAVAAALACAAFALLPVRAPATPFADVPANHWAYQAIASLAADGLIDGYPDGAFKGDRPLTRYEMAAIVARVVAKIEATGAGTASKIDLDKLQKLIDALKDELDALGVRVTTLEDAVASLDRRTKIAQAIAVHGTLLANGSFRSNTTTPKGVGAATGIDPFVNAYETSPDDNDPWEQSIGPQTLLRSDSRFNFIYTIDPNVTVSLPVHVRDYQYGGDDAQQLSITPDLQLDVKQAGAFTNLTVRAGELDNVASSRLGLAYRAPDAAQLAYQNPLQPNPRGFEFGGILAGLTTFQFTFARVDQTLLNTQGLPGSTAGIGFANTYFAPIVPAQGGFVQTGGAPATDTFTASGNGLASVYLSKKAVAGSVTITAYTGGGAFPTFSYLDATNQVVFGTPLPPGARVTIQYAGLGYTNNAIPQRYQTGVRINQQFSGLPGAEVGLSYHRLWDENLPQGSDPAAVNLGVNGAPSGDLGLVSDSVFGLDFQVPILVARGRDVTRQPLLFGEVAGSQYTPDQQYIAMTGATAAVAGLKLTFNRVLVTLQYQTVGANYMDGAPLRFYGNAPPTWANYDDSFAPQFFGFGNTLGINQTFDASIDAGTPGRSQTAANPALTFLYPVFNPFVAGGPNYNSAFAPNTQGPSVTLTGPMTIAGLGFDVRLFAQHLTQLQAQANSTSTFGPQIPTATRATFDKLDAGARFPVTIAGTRVGVDLAGTLEHLRRNDTTGATYIPYNPSLASTDPGALANFNAAAGTSAVVYTPNYINMYHTSLAAGASLPVTPDLTFNTRYSDQRYFGSYGTTVQQNIGGTKDQVDVGLMYTVPKTTSSVGLTFRNSTYKDAVLPTYNFNQNREDVNFTIRF